MSKKIEMKRFCSQCSYGHLDCSFDKPAEGFLPEGQTFWLMSENSGNNITFLYKLFILKSFLWHGKTSFDDNAEKLAAEKQKFFTKSKSD